MRKLAFLLAAAPILTACEMVDESNTYYYPPRERTIIVHPHHSHYYSQPAERVIIERPAQEERVIQHSSRAYDQGVVIQHPSVQAPSRVVIQHPSVQAPSRVVIQHPSVNAPSRVIRHGEIDDRAQAVVSGGQPYSGSTAGPQSSSSSAGHRIGHG